MYQLKITKSFKIDYKKLSKSEVEDTDTVIKILLRNERLETKYHDHAMRYAGTISVIENAMSDRIYC